MTDCPDAEIRDQLPLLVAGRLGPAERASVEAHVAACADCRAELALLRRVRAVTAAAPPIDAPRIAAAALEAARVRRPAVARSGAWRGWRVPAAAAAAVVLALLAYDGRRAPDEGERAAVAVGRSDSARPTDSAIAAEGGAEGLSFGGGLAELTDAELSALVASLEELDPLPADEPASVAPEIPFDLEGTT